MATSGTVSTSTYSGRYLKLTWERTSYSVANNTSTIKWTLKGAGDAPYSYYKAGNFKVVIAGDTVYSKSSDYRISLYNGTEVASGTKTIKHNSDGTKSFSVSVKGAIYTYAQNVSGSKTFTLNTIPRASSISATSNYVGLDSKITVSRASSAFTHTITWKSGSLSGTIATKSTSTSITWTLPTDLYDVIGSTGTSCTVTLTCTTYNGSTKVGDAKTCTLTAKTSSSRNGPTATLDVYASDDLTITLCGTDSTIILGVSDMAYTVTGKAQDGATIKSYKVTNGSVTKTTATGTFTNATSDNFVATVTDSRGYTSKQTNLQFGTVVNYIAPTATLKVSNVSVEGRFDLSFSGNYYTGTFLNNPNSITVEYRYKEDSGDYSAYIPVTDVSAANNKYSAQLTLDGLDYHKTYTVEYRITDKIKTVTSNIVTVNFLPVFDWGENDFNFNVPVYSSGPIQIHAMSAGCSEATTLTNTPAKIPVGNLYGKSGDLMELEDGGIKFLRDGTVLVMGGLHATGLAAGDTLRVCINMDGSNYSSSYAQTGSKTFTTVQLTPKIINVSKDDILYLYGANYTQAGGNVPASNLTLLTVIFLNGGNF